MTVILLLLHKQFINKLRAILEPDAAQWYIIGPLAAHALHVPVSYNYVCIVLFERVWSMYLVEDRYASMQSGAEWTD